MKRSYVKLFRDIQETPVFSNSDLLKVYIYCILNAAHKTRYIEIVTGRGKTTVTIQPAQLIWGRISCGERLQMKPRTAENHLKKLAKLGFILREPKKHFTKITVLQMESEAIEKQDVIKNDGQAIDRQWTGNRQAMDTNKNVKKEKKEEKREAPAPENDKPQPENEYTGGGKIALSFRVRSLFINAGGVCTEDDMRHFSKIAYSMRDIIKQSNPNGGRPSDDKITEAVKAVFELLPDWVKAKGFFSPSGIARNISGIVNEIRANKAAKLKDNAKEGGSVAMFKKRSK